MRLSSVFVPLLACLIDGTALADEPPQNQAQTQPAMNIDFRQRTGEATSLAMSGRGLTPDQVQELEARVVDEPGDVESRTKLLGYYFAAGRRANAVQHQKHVLWLIEHRPETPVLSTPFGDIDHILSHGAYDKARTLWERHLEQRPENLIVLWNASEFFNRGDQARTVELLTRGQALDPENAQWSESLGQIHLLKAQLGANPEEARRALKALEDALPTDNPRMRFYKLVNVAKAALLADERDKARQYANELLDMALETGGEWNYGNAIHHGNLVLGHLALLEDNVEIAEAHLIKAGRTPGSPQLNSFGPNMSLAKKLLERDRKKAVLEYFDLCAKFWNRPELAKWKADVEAGKIPNFRGNLLY